MHHIRQSSYVTKAYVFLTINLILLFVASILALCFISNLIKNILFMTSDFLCQYLDCLLLTHNSSFQIPVKSSTVE